MKVGKYIVDCRIIDTHDTAFGMFFRARGPLTHFGSKYSFVIYVGSKVCLFRAVLESNLVKETEDQEGT